MFTSKFFLIFNFLAVLAIGTSVFFQYDEMASYGLDKTLIERFTGGGSSSPAPAAAAETAKPTEAAKPAKAEKAK
jgi:hypothetical protein